MRQVLYVNQVDDLKFTYNGGEVDFETAQMYKNITMSDGDGHVIPLWIDEYTHCTRRKYQAGTQFKATLELPETITPEEDYTVIFVKKGVPFNERNKWTFTQRAKATDDVDTLKEKITEYLDSNPQLGLCWAVETNDIVPIDDNDYSDYTVILADGFATGKVTITSAVAPVCDINAIKELLSKAAADAGFEYTNNDNSVDKLYPGYNAWATEDAPNRFTVYTIFQAEPRVAAKPLDMAVNQVIQVIIADSNEMVDFLENFIISDIA